jgi:hypothetical protein
MLMLTDNLEWWARRFQRAARRKPSDGRRTGEDAGDRVTRTGARDARDEPHAPRLGRFTRRALQER